jgi:DNA-binding Lrp family transcriptional regulator
MGVVHADAFPRAALNDDLMACRDQLAYAGGHETDTVFVDLDLAWNANSHDSPQAPAQIPARQPQRSQLARWRFAKCVPIGGRYGRICCIMAKARKIPAPLPLDRYDRAILAWLQQNARTTNAKLAEQVSLSESACLRRVRALEQSGLIQGYTALIDQHLAGYPVNVFVSITLDRQSQSGLDSFENAVRRIPEVMECYLMTGEHDYLLRIVVADLDDFERVHAQHLTRLPSVIRIQSSFAMRTVTRSLTLPAWR